MYSESVNSVVRASEPDEPVTGMTPYWTGNDDSEDTLLDRY